MTASAPQTATGTQPLQLANVTGLILAGGEGRRMGGADKGLLEIDGVALAARATERLRPQVGSIMVSANRNLDRYRALGLEPVTDTFSDPGRTAGPLAGIAAGLARCDTEWLVSVPCDSPHLPTDLVARLHTVATGAKAPAAFARTLAGVHPVFMLLRRDLVDSLQGFLAEGGRRVREWQDAVGAIAVEFPDEAAFANVNTPHDLARLGITHPKSRAP